MNSYANDAFPNKTLALDVIAGTPQFLGLEISYLGWSTIVPGFGFGSAPINGLLNSMIRLSSVPVSFSLPDTYNLYPTATYGLYSYSGFIKIFPGKSGFFSDILLNYATFTANVSANLKNETTGGTSSNAVTGTANLNQLTLGLTVGYQFRVSNFFFSLAGGGGWLFTPAYAVSLGGTAASVIGVIPNGEQAFSSAKSQIQTSFDSAVASYRATIKFMPIFYINVGIAL